MNRKILKLIALISLTLDHIGFYVHSFLPLPLYIILRNIGRLCFPIMCLFLVNGYKYSKDKRKYLLRLLICASISQIPFFLLGSYKLNAIFSLILGLLFLLVLNSKENIIIKILLLIVISLLTFICDYSLITILYILTFYYLKPYLSIIPISLFILTLLITNNINLLIVNLGLLLIPILLYFYKEKRVKESKLFKLTYYIYFPLHLYIIYFITLFIF